MIKEEMKFAGYKAFFEQKERIKIMYNNLTRKEKELYKYYVYSRRQLTNYTCDLIWQFLNNAPNDAFIIEETTLKKECSKYRM